MLFTMNTQAAADLSRAVQSSMRAGMTQLAQQLGCNTDVTEDASFTLKQAYHLLSGKGCMPLDIMTAATLYLTVRLANLPYTLAETARLAGRPTHVLVAAYKKVAMALDTQMRQQQKENSSTDHSNTEKEDEHDGDLKQINQPPPVDFANFAHRHLCTLPNLKCSAAQNVSDAFLLPRCLCCLNKQSSDGAD